MALFFRDFQFLTDLQGVLVGEIVVVGEIVSGGAVTAGNGGERITPLDGVGGVAHLLLHRLDFRLRFYRNGAANSIAFRCC